MLIAQQCPFQDRELDKEYHGYEYGASDYIIYREDLNEAILIGSLLFHQIVAHHFFQSPESAYRVDPTKLIRMFSIQTGVNYTVPTVIKKYARWFGGMSRENKFTTYFKDKWYEVSSHDTYTIYKRTDDKTSYLGIALSKIPEEVVNITIDDVIYPAMMISNEYDLNFIREVEEICV